MEEKVTEGHEAGAKDLVYPTVHNIYNGKVNADDSEEKLVTRSPSTKRSKINRLVYAKLHRKSHGGSTVDKLKGKYEGAAKKEDATPVAAAEASEKEEKGEETKQDLNNLKLKKDTVEELKNKYSPASFGYPKVISKIPKKVQFSNVDPDAAQPPIPKPRASLANKPPQEEAVVVEEVKVDVITPEEATRFFASTSTLNSTVDAVGKDENSNDIEKSPTESALDEIEFAEPEEKHFIVRASSSEDSVVQFENTLSEFIMEGKPKEKKRSSSFRRILSGNFFGGKDSKKKGGKKPEGNENGAFNRNSTQRHTIGGSYGKKEKEVAVQLESDAKRAEELFAQMHINKFNDIRNNFARYNTRPNFPAEEYVCMDTHNAYRNQPLYSNSSSVDKYIDTSSSTSTLESEKQHNTYENSLIAQAEMRQVQQNENLRRALSFNRGPERFTETPPRAHETYQNLQLVKPKAVIPINSERALPNPYQDEKKSDNVTNNLNRSDSKQFPEKNTPYFEETYGTVFDSVESVRANRLNSRVSSPRSPSLEGSKLRLPSNRERIELQPRIKSPIPQTKVSTDKIIATELLKAARSPTPTRKTQQNSPSHQRLEIQIDYPESVEGTVCSVDSGIAPASHSTPKSVESGVKGRPPVSPKKAEAVTNQIIANAVVHAESPQKGSPVFNETYRATTPVNQRLSSGSAKSSPEKAEIRQQVEAYCWKELKKLKELKEKEERDLYYYQLQTYGYADDAVLNRRSRSLTPSGQRGGRRSLSLPREVAPVRTPQYGRGQQPIPEGRPLPRIRTDPTYGYLQQQFVRNSPERRTIGPIGTNHQQQQQRPIFNRGSLSNQKFYENQASLKKVSFSAAQRQDNWPTRNGYTQSPPQRRLDRQRESSVDDDVFLPQNVVLRHKQRQQQQQQQQPQVKMEEVYLQKMVAPSYAHEPLYAPKHVRVFNKSCDTYGQIHDAGVVYGQLQANPVARPPPGSGFVRGSRLTASANDMYKRYQNVGADPRYRSDVVFQPIYEANYAARYHQVAPPPTRPLPPVPSERSTSLLPMRRLQADAQCRARVSGK